MGRSFGRGAGGLPDFFSFFPGARRSRAVCLSAWAAATDFSYLPGMRNPGARIRQQAPQRPELSKRRFEWRPVAPGGPAPLPPGAGGPERRAFPREPCAPDESAAEAEAPAPAPGRAHLAPAAPPARRAAGRRATRPRLSVARWPAGRVEPSRAAPRREWVGRQGRERERKEGGRERATRVPAAGARSRAGCRDRSPPLW